MRCGRRARPRCRSGSWPGSRSSLAPPVAEEQTISVGESECRQCDHGEHPRQQDDERTEAGRSHPDLQAMQQGPPVAVVAATGALLYLLPSVFVHRRPTLGSPLVALTDIGWLRLSGPVWKVSEGDPRRWATSNLDAPPPSVPKAMRAGCQPGGPRTMGATDHLEVKSVNPRVQLLEPPARRTASARVRTSSFCMTDEMWRLTVIREMKRRSAMSAVVSPLRSSSSTSYSRLVSSTLRRWGSARKRRRPRVRNSSTSRATSAGGRGASPTTAARSSDGSFLGSMSLRR